MLNVVRYYPVPGPYGATNQATWSVDRCFFGHWTYHMTTFMGDNGTKGVAIPSKYPISNERFWEIPNPDALPHRGTLGITIQVDGLTHQVFSARFNLTPDSENRAGHEQSISIVRSEPSTWDGSGLHNVIAAAENPVRKRACETARTTSTLGDPTRSIGLGTGGAYRARRITPSSWPNFFGRASGRWPMSKERIGRMPKLYFAPRTCNRDSRARPIRSLTSGDKGPHATGKFAPEPR
jgi:hypothetical protein